MQDCFRKREKEEGDVLYKLIGSFQTKIFSEAVFHVWEYKM